MSADHRTHRTLQGPAPDRDPRGLQARRQGRVRDAQVGGDLLHRRPLGADVEIDRVAAELLAIGLTCHEWIVSLPPVRNRD